MRKYPGQESISCRKKCHAIFTLIPHYPLGSLITRKINFSKESEDLILHDKIQGFSKIRTGSVRKPVVLTKINFFVECLPLVSEKMRSTNFYDQLYFAAKFV